MNQEPSGIDTQAHRVVDERERDECQQDGQTQQYHVHPAQVLVHIVHQVLLIGHIRHFRVFLQLVDYPHQRVAVGIVRLQLELERGHEGVSPQKLRGVGTHGLRLLLQSLFLTDIVDVAGIGTVVEVATEALGLVHAHIVAQHHSHRQVLLHPCRQVSRCLHGENNDTQQHQHHSRTDTQGDPLHTTPAASLLLAFFHLLYVRKN